MKFVAVTLPLCLLAGLTGCASIMDGSTETVSLQANSGAAPLDNVQCQLANKSGSWDVTAPGAVTVHRGAEPLDVKCTKDGFVPEDEQVNSKTNNDVYGNIALGGGLGATVDTVDGAAWDYPQLISVPMQPVPTTAVAAK